MLNHVVNEVILTFHHVGSSLHLLSQDGATALMIASYWGHSIVVRILLKAGSNINTTGQVRYRLYTVNTKATMEV